MRDSLSMCIFFEVLLDFNKAQLEAKYFRCWWA